MSAEAAVEVAASPLGDVSREELIRRLGDPALTIVDVLPAESYDSAHIPGAINLPIAEIEDRGKQMLPDPAAEIVVYCAKFT